MKRIGLLSDTHSRIYHGVFDFFKDCDEIWHAGDIGDIETLLTLEDFKTTRRYTGTSMGLRYGRVVRKYRSFIVKR